MPPAFPFAFSRSRFNTQDSDRRRAGSAPLRPGPPGGGGGCPFPLGGAASPLPAARSRLPPSPPGGARTRGEDRGRSLGLSLTRVRGPGIFPLEAPNTEMAENRALEMCVCGEGDVFSVNASRV